MHKNNFDVFICNGTKTAWTIVHDTLAWCLTNTIMFLTNALDYSFNIKCYFLNSMCLTKLFAQTMLL